MAIAAFPMPSVSGSNPTPLFHEMLEEEFVVARTIYDDNGADTALQHGGNGKKTWILKYNGLTLALAAIIKAHIAAAKYDPDSGSAYGFSFTDRDSGTTYTNVHYAPGGYKQSHTKTWIWAFEITLEKRP